MFCNEIFNSKNSLYVLEKIIHIYFLSILYFFPHQKIIQSECSNEAISRQKTDFFFFYLHFPLFQHTLCIYNKKFQPCHQRRFQKYFEIEKYTVHSVIKMKNKVQLLLLNTEYRYTKNPTKQILARIYGHLDFPNQHQISQKKVSIHFQRDAHKKVIDPG